MDRMYIRDLAVKCIIGTRPVERRRRQTVVINLALETDLGVAGASDDLRDAVNYSHLTDAILSMAAASHFFLIEKLAAAIAAICLADPRIKAATVTVDKPAALPAARSAAVEITRRKRR